MRKWPDYQIDLDFRIQTFPLLLAQDLKGILMKLKRPMLAFIHTERTGGTTLEHILRRSFFLRHIDVRPLSKEANGVFGPRDLKRLLLINPMLNSIAGHSIRPVYSRLESVVPNIRYITLMRNPITRYISHYQYAVEKRGMNITFERFAEQDEFSNLQTRKIAGCDNIDVAKDFLDNSMFMVGLIEEFEQFLVLLRRKLNVHGFDPMYRIRNSGLRSSLRKQLESNPTYIEMIKERNKLDIDLYQYAANEVIPKEKSAYGRDFDRDLASFRSDRQSMTPRMIKSYVDYAIRKAYYDTTVGAFRCLHGLKYRGSY